MAKIITFGDSIMKGVVADLQPVGSGIVKYRVSDQSFVACCERRLGISVDNLARFGSTISNGLKNLDRYSATVAAGDYVVLEFGGNDCNFDWKSVAANPAGVHRPFTTLAAFRQCYAEAIDMVRRLGAQPILLSLPPIDGQLFFDYICQELDRDKIMQFIGDDVHYIQNWHEQYNLEVFKLACNKRVPIIDISTKFLEQRCLNTFYCADGMHPNEAGHHLIAEVIMQYVGEAVSRTDFLYQVAAKMRAEA
ncbi:MAG: SGNH/GDSL hydrolase family protein [Paludibacteraceae bacterium]